MDLPTRPPPERQAFVQAFLAQETALLVAHRWTDWLALFSEDGELWVPSWVGHVCASTDPELKVSIVRARGRRQLAERVQRALSGASPVTSTLPRLWRSTSDVLITADRGDVLAIEASCMSALLDAATCRTSEVHSRALYELSQTADGWRIDRKTVHIFTHPLPPAVDFYLL